jgi:C_GCAxxG_C_C family probable redox protein
MGEGADMDNMLQMAKYKNQGFYCSQILLLMGLDLLGKENPDLVRAMNSLAGGIGFNGLCCGALTGAACLLGLYAGRGKPEEEDDERLNLMLIDLVDWFKGNIGEQYGGINCDDILEGKRENYPLRCPFIVDSVFQKCKELLVDYGFDLNTGRE